MKNESNMNADGADNTQKPQEDLTPPSPLPSALTPNPSPVRWARGTSGEGEDPQPGDPNKAPPVRSQSELNLPPVEPWPEPVNGQKLFDEIKVLLMRIVVMPKWAVEAVVLWIVHTYAFELRNVATYLGIESPEKECGKTTLMSLLSRLVNRPEVASNISSPAFYRAIEELRPTLLIDEADTLLPGNAQLRGILNSGYTQEMAYVLRITSDPLPESSTSTAKTGKKTKGGSRLARFSCWGPKAIAQIGNLPDTLRSRCIVIRMQKKTAHEQCERFQEDKALFARLRSQCVRFVLDHAAKIAAARPELPKALSDRGVQIWEPLVILADLAGGDWPQAARQAAVGLSASAEHNNPVGSLLFGIWLLFATAGGGRMFSRTLVQGLNGLADRPWGEMRNGKGITDAWLAAQLQPYGIQPRTLRIGQAQAKGYCEEDFQEAFQRYMSRGEIDALRATLAAAAESKQKPEVGGETPESIGPKPESGEQRKDEPEDGAAAA
jgi:putative DNA primase/helicase